MKVYLDFNSNFGLEPKVVYIIKAKIKKFTQVNSFYIINE